jgi:hypothetical protein
VSTVVVTSSGSGQTGVSAGNGLVNQVAVVVGGENEAEVRSQALAAINRVRTRLNKRDWNFMRKQASAITLVDGTKTYTLPTAFKKPAFAILQDTSSNADWTLRYANDAWFSHWNEDRETSGRPQWYTLRNHYDDGLIELYPIPDASAASDWTLLVDYYGRISNIQDTSTAIDLPEEVEDVLVLGGQYFLLREREKNSPSLPMARADFLEGERLLQVYDRRIEDENPRFRVGTSRSNQTLGTIWIKVT